MSDPYHKTVASPLARLRLARLDRHDSRVVFDIQGAIAVLDHTLFAQSPWGNLWPASQQAILVRNPDAWRLRILSGPPAERGGIASGEWVLDSSIKLEWSGWSLALEVLEPGFESGPPQDVTVAENFRKNDSRSSLYMLASNLAAAQLRLDQQADKQKKRDTAFGSKRKKLGQVLKIRLLRLRQGENRLARAKTEWEQAQSRQADLREEIASQQIQLKNVAYGLSLREKRIQNLRRKASIRWRDHIKAATGILRENKSLISQKLAAIQAIVDQLTRRESELLQAETELAQARTRLGADTFSLQQEYLSKQGDILLKQGGLAHQEERLRAEARILAELGAPLREALGKLEPQDSQSIIQLLQDRITSISAEPVRAAALDSWEKRIELWASSLTERELAVSLREQELLRLVAEYREIRERRESELSSQFAEKHYENIKIVAQMPDSIGDLEKEPTRDILSFHPKGTNPRSETEEKTKPTAKPAETTLVQNGKPAKSKIGQHTKPLDPREITPDEAEIRATLIRRETELGERARRLGEEAVVLERYRMRLLEASENPARSREEILLLRSQLRKRMGLEESTLKAAKKELLELLKSLKRQGAKISRRAKAISRELLNKEEKTAQMRTIDLLLGREEARPKAA